MKPADGEPKKKYIFVADFKTKKLNLKFVSIFESQNIKTYSQRVIHQIDQKKCLWLKTLKRQEYAHM